MSNLPYDSEVKYIEFTGSQYINTEVFADTLNLDIEFVSEGLPYFGWVHNNAANGTWIAVASNYIYWKNWNGNYKYSIGLQYGWSLYRYSMSYGFYKNDILLKSFSSELGNDNIASQPLLVGRCYDYYINSPEIYTTNYNNNKINSLKIYKNNTLVRDFIPVRVGQVGYFYDKISGELFGNDGTGNFVVGPDEVVVEEGGHVPMLGRRGLMNKYIDFSKYAVHKKKNAPVMAICYAQGWAANENYMTFEEAAAVTDIGNAFNYKTFESFDEFQYFTGVQNIPNFAFRDCHIVSITLPEQIVSIGNNAFYWSKIKILRIPENVIPSTAGTILSRNEVLEKIIWDSNIPPIYNFIDSGYIKPNFTEITSNNPLYYCQDGCIWSADKTKLYMVPEGAFSRFSFIGTERYIADTFFHVVGSMTIPSHISDFKTYRKDTNFRHSEITELDMSACNVGDKIPNFRDGYITTIKMPQCTTIGGFGNFMSVTITNMILNQSTVPTMTHRQCFYPAPPTNIYVPDSAVNDYKTANNWANYADNIKPLSEYNQN